MNDMLLDFVRAAALDCVEANERPRLCADCGLQRPSHPSPACARYVTSEEKVCRTQLGEWFKPVRSLEDL